MARSSGHQNKLTGQAGEYLVVAELARRGFIATTFAGNVPAYDIIAIDERGRHLSIQVKASNSGSWQFDVSNFCEIKFQGNQQIIGSAKKSLIVDLIVVLVILSHNQKIRDRFFILKWAQLRNIIISGHKKYLHIHNGIRPRNPKSMHCAVNVSQILRYENCWNAISGSM